jgi:hypothetical protein
MTAVSNLQTIPARNDLPWYHFKISIGGVLYTLHFLFNYRMQRWMVDINDANDNQIMSGIPCLINRDMFGQYVTLPLPPGIIFCTDNTNQDSQPTQYSFGVGNTLWYATT